MGDISTNLRIYGSKMAGGRQNALLIGAFVLLIVLNVVLRFPITPHEIGDDSFYIHDLADSIIDSGSIKWAIHPLSYFGLYALSYPAGGPTIFAEVPIISGIDISWSIYIASLLFALFGIFSMYLLAAEFTGRSDLGLLAAFLFSVSPLSLKYTLWTSSTRGVFLMVLPLFIWCFLRYAKTKALRYLTLIVMTLALLASLHKMFLLAVLIVLGYIIAYYLPGSIKRIKTRYLGCALIIVYILLFTLPFILIQNEWTTLYLSHYLSLGGGCFSHILSAIVTMGARLGFLLPLSVLGLVALGFKSEKQIEDWFLIGTTTLFAPLLFYEEYIYMFQSPLLVLLSLSGLLAGIEFFRKILHTRSTKMVLICILILCVVFASFTLYIRYTNEYESGHGNYLYGSTYALAQYIQTNPDSVELIGNSVATRQISAFVPNPTSLARSVDYLIFDRVDKGALSISLKPIPISPNGIAGFVRMPFGINYDDISRSESTFVVMPARLGSDMIADVTQKKVYDNALDELWYEKNSYGLL